MLCLLLARSLCRAATLLRRVRSYSGTPAGQPKALSAAALARQLKAQEEEKAKAAASSSSSEPPHVQETQTLSATAGAGEGAAAQQVCVTDRALAATYHQLLYLPLASTDAG